MKEIRYAFRSSNYHRKTKYLLFLFSTLFIFLTTLAYTLIRVQKEYMQQLGKRWESIQSVAPNLNEDRFLQIQYSNQQLLDRYHWCLYSLVFGFALFLIASLLWIVLSRKTESYRYVYLGVSLPKKMLQFSIEVLLPLLYSFIFVTVVLFIGHQSFMTHSEQLNERLVTNYYDQGHVKNLYSSSTTEKVPSTLSDHFQATKTNQKNDSDDSNNCVMNFNKKTLFMVNYNHLNASFLTLFTIIMQIFLWFLGITLIVSTFFSYYAYRWSLRHINQFYLIPTSSLKEG